MLETRCQRCSDKFKLQTRRRASRIPVFAFLGFQLAGTDRGDENKVFSSRVSTFVRDCHLHIFRLSTLRTSNWKCHPELFSSRPTLINSLRNAVLEVIQSFIHRRNERKLNRKLSYYNLNWRLAAKCQRTRPNKVPGVRFNDWLGIMGC